LEYRGNKIIKIKPNQSYKYLGIEINLNLDWGDQKTILETSVNKFSNFLKGKHITIQQKITIFNVILAAKFAYRMNIIKFEES
jgi:hypothetical protein